MQYTSSDVPVPDGIVVIERGVSAQEFGPKLNRTSADVLWHAVLLGSKKQCFYSTIASAGAIVSQTRETGALGSRRNGQRTQAITFVWKRARAARVLEHTQVSNNDDLRFGHCEHAR